ncbi:MAG TPA: protein kinase, partial [Gemmataceae bacterium]
MYRCPDRQRWRALLADDLPAAEQADLNGHLELCPDCQRTLEECAAHRTAWAVTARSLGQPGPTREAALRDVIDRLKLDPDADRDDGHDGAELPLDFLDPPGRPGSLGRIGPYEVLEEVGRGGMGVVLKALDPGLHRVVAIKVLAPQLAVSGTARKRFTREARAAAAVQHENVVTIHAVEEFKGLPYLVMQYVAGPSVQQRLSDDGGPLPVAEVLRIGTQTAAGLAAAHAQGLVHRDVKPANILLENGVERVKLTDFSLARAIDDASVTQTGVVAGTPPYMAPEQARGEALDHRADLFSLGSVLYALCTGRPPFRGSNSLDVLRRVSEDTPVSIRTLNPEIPAWLETIVRKLMAKNREDRFQSAGEVATLLERCLAHWQQPTAVPLPAIPGVRARVSRPRRLVVGLAAAAAAVMLAVTVLRLRTDNGTLVIEVDDPQAKVTVDGTDIVVTGAGVQEFRLKAGSYTYRTSKDGKPEKTEVVSIKQGEKTPLKVTFEPDARAAAAGTVSVPVLSDIPHVGRLFTSAAVEREWAKAEQAAAQAHAAQARIAEMEKLDEQLLNLRVQKQRLLNTLGPNHPQVKEIDETINLFQQTYGARHDRVATTDGARVTKPRRSFPTEAGEVASVVFSPDGKQLVIADWTGRVYAYDFATGKKRFTIGTDKLSENRFLAVSPDGKSLATVGNDQTVRLFDLASGRQLRVIHGQPDPYYAVAFSPDGKTLAVGGNGPPRAGGILELWDLSSGKLRVATEFADWVTALAFPPGVEDRLAVGTGGANVRMVYPSTGKEEYSLTQ